jgi:hypothetical protein
MKNLNKNLSFLIAIKNKIIKYIIKIIIKYLFLMLILKYCKKIKRIISSTENFMETDKIRFNYLKKNYGYILNDLPIYEHTHQTNKTIFWCWLQGVEEAPKLYLSNLNSLIMNCKDYNIIIINETNMLDYIKFPNYIIEKYKKGYMTPTHFSDLLRLELLIKYGGTWSDASVLVTECRKDYFTKDLFFFQNRSDFGCVGSSWFITSEKGSPVLRTTRDLLYEYWRINCSLYNYFTFHIFLKISCEKYPQDLKNIQYVSNLPPHWLQSKLGEVFSQEEYNRIINNITIHKLTIRLSNIKNNSFYHHVIEEYYNKK